MEHYLNVGITACTVFLIAAVAAIWTLFITCTAIEIIASWF